MSAPVKRDYTSQPVSVQLGLEAVIVGLSEDLTDLRTGKCSPQDALARAAVAKQLFNGVRLYLQAMKTLDALPANPSQKGKGDG
mgnify:CR=1 FL=1